MSAPATADQLAAIRTLAEVKGVSERRTLFLAREYSGRYIDTLAELSSEEAYRVIDVLDRMPVRNRVTE